MALEADLEALQLVHLLDQLAEIDHHPVPQDAGLALAQDPRGDEVEDDLLVAHHHRVPRVVPPLVAGDDVEALAQHVDDLALALVAPLHADHDEIGHDSSRR
jgi:hypothetical protein